MQFTKWEVRIIYTLCLIIGFALGAHNEQVYSVAHEIGAGQQGHDANGIGEGGILHRTWLNPEAFWGAIMTVLTVAGFAILGWQIYETRKATTLTKQSVDAYIDRERGRMVYSSASTSHVTTKDIYYVSANFISRGGEGVTVISDFAHHQYAEQVENVQAVRPSFAGEKNWFVNVTEQHHIQITLDKEKMSKRSPTHHLYVTFFLKYDTAFGTYLKKQTLRYPASGRPIRITDKRLTSDVLIEPDR